MNPLDHLPPLREVIGEHGLFAKKSLGQNFLLDLNLTDKIARSAGGLSSVTVIEVGPGPGGLTRSLIAAGAEKVIAIERDMRCVGALRQIQATAPNCLEIISGDALKIDFAGLTSRPTKIVSNLPYNIATPLLIGWLKAEPWPPFYESMTLMFQREVAERIVAIPGTKAYGRLSVLSGWRTEARILFDLPPRAFTPPPKVRSSVVELRPRPHPLFADPGALERVTAAAFGQRRKMLRQSLKTLGIDPQALLAEAGIDPTGRAEDVDIAGFATLSNAFSRISRNKGPVRPE